MEVVPLVDNTRPREPLDPAQVARWPRLSLPGASLASRSSTCPAPPDLAPHPRSSLVLRALSARAPPYPRGDVPWGVGPRPPRSSPWPRAIRRGPDPHEAPAAPRAAALKWSLRRFLASSIGRKCVMAVTGLSLTLFLLVHMAGNLVYARTRPSTRTPTSSRAIAPPARRGRPGGALPDPCRVRRGADRAEQDLTRGKLQGGARHGPQDRGVDHDVDHRPAAPRLPPDPHLGLPRSRAGRGIRPRPDGGGSPEVPHRLRHLRDRHRLVGLRMWHAFQSAFERSTSPLPIARSSRHRPQSRPCSSPAGGIPFLFFLGWGALAMTIADSPAGSANSTPRSPRPHVRALVEAQFDLKLVNPASRRKFDVIVVG